MPSYDPAPLRAPAASPATLRRGRLLLLLLLLAHPLEANEPPSSASSATIAAEAAVSAGAAGGAGDAADRAAPFWIGAEWTDPAGERRHGLFPGSALLATAPGSLVTLHALRTPPAPPDAPPPFGRGPAPWDGASADGDGGLTVRARAEPGPALYALGGGAEAEGKARSGANDAADAPRLCLFVPLSATLSRGAYGYLDVEDTRLGYYRDPRRSGIEKVRSHPASYRPPRHFLRIDPKTRDLFVSPTVRLRELVQPDEETGERHTAYAPVAYPLLEAIETLRAALAAKGAPPRALHFLSLFRTPRHNRSIGSSPTSRHPYGDAVDFVIDLDGDGFFDDLTGDGKADATDGLWMVALIEELQAEGFLPMGGIGLYVFRANDHPLTMHLDLRGHRATWAYRYGAGGRRREFGWKSVRFAKEDAAERRRRRERRAGRR